MKSKYIKYLILFSLILICTKVNALSFEVDGLKYTTISDNEVEVSKGSKTSGTLVIPESVTYNDITYTVTSIGRHAFQDCSGFTGSLTIPNSVTSIRYGAFSGCSGFTGSLTIPNSVTSIEDFTFYQCSGFTGSLTIPNSVTSIGPFAFSGCSGFTGSLTIPNSVTSIGTFAFQNCSSFTGSLTIPNSVTSIGNGAFSYCSGLTRLTIPNSVTSIEEYAFGFCSNLSYVISEIEEPYAINDNILCWISSDATLQIPKGTMAKYEKYIGWTKYFKEFKEDIGTTGNTYSLSINTSDHGTVVFHDVTIKNKDKKRTFALDAGESATITFNPDNGYTIKSLKVNNTEVSLKAIADNQYTISRISENTVIDVEYDVAYKLTITSTGNGVTSYDGTNIRGESCTFTIVKGASASVAFTPDEGYKIRSVKLNSTNVAASVVNNQYTIDNISGNNTLEVEYIEVSPIISFADVAVKNICVKNWDTDGDGELDEKEAAAVTDLGTAFKGNTNITSFNELKFFTGLNTIASYAFQRCSSLSSITIPNVVTSIGEYAFYGCSGLASVTIPNVVTSIGEYAFYGCSGLASVSIPNSVITIGDCSFENCSSLTSINLGNGVTSIGLCAFSGCKDLVSVTIPNSVTVIGNSAFSVCI